MKQLALGGAEVMGELFASVRLVILTGILFSYIVLVPLHKDFFRPFVILTALPLPPGGAFVALGTNMFFSMPSLICLILAVEYAIVARRGHDDSDGHLVVAPMSRHDALIDACHKRARPVIMTTLAMGAGMLPIAVGWGAADSSFRSPMAVAVIGGLLTSTVLSLLVIPAVFTVVDDFGAWVRRRLGRGGVAQV